MYWFSTSTSCSHSLWFHHTYISNQDSVAPQSISKLGDWCRSPLGVLWDDSFDSLLDTALMARLAHKARGLLHHTTAPTRSSFGSNSSSCLAFHCCSHTRGLGANYLMAHLRCFHSLQARGLDINNCSMWLPHFF